MKPVGWPRYMIEKRLKDRRTAYYWNPPNRDVAAGFSQAREALGPSYAEAVERANFLNLHLDSWRAGRDGKPPLEAQPGYGTLGWLFERYRRSDVYQKKVGHRAKPGYERALRAIEDIPTKDGRTVGHLPLSAISTLAVDKIYAKLQVGPRKSERTRQANYPIDIARRAWKVVHRLHPSVVPVFNPWQGVERVGRKGAKAAATRAEAYALAQALKDIGEPHLAAAVLICFEWHQRPEHVVGRGAMTWACLRPPEYPNHVQVRHPKTGALVWLPLEDQLGLLFPEIEDYLATLPRLGLPIVLTSGERGPCRPYAMVFAQRRVREARRHAGLGEHVTLDACRHGGMTELGDAGISEQGVMALSGHKTPQAARLYIHRTDAQRLVAARQRRAWIDTNESGTRVRIGGQTPS